MKLDGLFIDMYGTLTTGDRAAVEGVCAALVRDTGVLRTPRELAIAWGERFFEALTTANGAEFRRLHAIEAETLVATMAGLRVQVDPEPYIAGLVRYWREPPLQAEVREFLAECTLPLCVVSNADCEDLGLALDRCAVRPRAVVCSEDACSYKPDPQIFEAALRVTGWRREHVLHVGDSLHSDVGGARAAGIRSVWINRAHRIHDIGTEQPNLEFADLLEMQRWLAGGGGAP